MSMTRVSQNPFARCVALTITRKNGMSLEHGYGNASRKL
ncbi:hypothetical protein K788_0000086 [Paraburkholderia caribensis MBA4]|uniref:Uncharacterized protein n=1 Tax=Paraburkholderia caribensis MBA4 TaxID=1323664 RepID=A0A0N7JVD5_9BURK|nr:hypothetical protein K788_0000086 [Paraburkholderia caribensis MBA4]